MQDIKAIFDIGNGYLKGVVFGEEDGHISILAKNITKTKGLRKGKILDNGDLSKSLLEITEHFTKKLGGDFIDDAVVCLSHPGMERERVNDHKRIISGTIAENDINHLSKVVEEIAKKDNYETIKIIPVYWLIDDEKKEKDPLGIQAKKLTLVADVFRIPRNFYQNILDIFDKTSLHVVDMVPNILATTEATMDFDHKDLGTLLIDIGTNQTSFVAYEDGHPLEYGIIPIGSEDVTKDISIGMQVDIKEAEHIKTEKGIILAKHERGDDTELDAGFLSEIISARYEEIFDKINTRLKKLHKDGRLAGGVLLSGGGSKMPGLGELAKEVFKLAVFDAKNTKLHAGDITNNKQFTNTIGAYLRHEQFSGDKRGGFNFSFDIFKRIAKFFKDLF